MRRIPRYFALVLKILITSWNWLRKLGPNFGNILEDSYLEKKNDNSSTGKLWGKSLKNFEKILKTGQFWILKK